jgi:hypothetical protein
MDPLKCIDKNKLPIYPIKKKYFKNFVIEFFGLIHM